MKKFFAAGLAVLAGLAGSTSFADSNATGGGLLNSESVFLGSGPFNHAGATLAPGNSTASAVFSGTFTANRVRFTGTLQEINTATWANEADILVTSPTASVTQWNNGGPGATYTGPLPFDNLATLSTAETAAGTWNLEFIDTFDDDDGFSADQSSNDVTMFLEQFEETVDTNWTSSLGTLNDGDSVSTVGELALANLFDTYTFTLATAGDFGAVTSFENVFTNQLLDTEIALFDSAGILLGENDDGGPGLYSQLNFTGLAAGNYTLVVGGFNTTFADGFSVTPGGSIGDYRLDLFFAVPEPTSAGLIGLVGLCLAARRRRA